MRVAKAWRPFRVDCATDAIGLEPIEFATLELPYGEHIAEFVGMIERWVTHFVAEGSAISSTVCKIGTIFTSDCKMPEYKECFLSDVMATAVFSALNGLKVLDIVTRSGLPMDVDFDTLESLVAFVVAKHQTATDSPSASLAMADMENSFWSGSVAAWAKVSDQLKQVGPNIASTAEFLSGSKARSS